MRRPRRAKAARAAAQDARRASRARRRDRDRARHPRARDPHAAQRHPGAERADRRGRSARARARMGRARSRARPSISRISRPWWSTACAPRRADWCCATSRFARARSPRRSARRSRRAPRRRVSPPTSRSRSTCPSSSSAMRVRLRAALENLVDNAVKFTERGRVALVGRAPRRRRAGATGSRFTFTDSGIGLTQAPRSRGCSVRSRRRTRRRAPLWRRGARARVRAAARQSDGRRSHGESAPGQRQHVSLSVTRRASRPRRRAARAAHGKAPRATQSLRVLCAEDNPYARVVLNTILTELGHRVDFAGTGEAAVAAVERGGYDLVLMDVTLPGMDGLAATRAIRALQRRGGARADHRHFGPHRAARRGSRARGRHECISGEAGEPGGAGARRSRRSCA